MDDAAVACSFYMHRRERRSLPPAPVRTHHYCPVVSPLTNGSAFHRGDHFFSEAGLPVYPSIVPMPADLTDVYGRDVAQGNAEFLAISVLMQMVAGGHAPPLCHLADCCDMRTGGLRLGIECGMLHMAFAQMARFL